MDRFDQYRVFVQVAEMGSFIKAADALDLPRASVSAAVRQLEAQVGARLLHRTTRQVRLTADGAQLLEQIRPLLAAVEDIDQLFQAGQRQAAGRLTVDVPSRIARRLIVPALPGLLGRHPRLQLVLRSADRVVDLVREGVDCAVRVGPLGNSSLVVRPLGCVALINCASPAYLAERGEPETPDNLSGGHLAVGYASPRTGRALPWEYVSADGAARFIDMPGRVVVNNAESYIACCRAGLGLIQIPRYDVQHLLDAGELAEVLPSFRPAPMPVSLLYSHRHQQPRRLAVFQEWFRTLMQPYFEP